MLHHSVLNSYYWLLGFMILSLGCLLPILNAQSNIDTVADYAALKFHANLADTVFVDHPRYYGLFYRDTSLQTENFGTTIQTISGFRRRIHRNYSPRFWAIGGRATDPLIRNVDREVDAINSAAIAAYEAGGDTVLIDSIYPIDRSVYLLDGNTYLGTSDSAGFRRIAPPRTVLRDTAQVGDRQILVENNDGFRTYQEINIAAGFAFDSLAGFVSYRASVAPNLGGDSIIWLSGRPIQRMMYPGDTVSLFFAMMDIRFQDIDSIHLENLVFDGNQAKYQLSADWRVNTTIKLPTTALAVIDNCRFYRIPNENMILCGAQVRNCSGRDLNGSATHISCQNNEQFTTLQYNDYLFTNVLGNALMQHSEAAITFSANVHGLHVSYNTFRQVNEYGLGIFKPDDANNLVTDNLFDTDQEITLLQFAYPYAETNTIYNNKQPSRSKTSIDSCWRQPPILRSARACADLSSYTNPLRLGDTIELVFDSIYLRNTNENFVKYIRPLYDTTYFRIVDMEMSTFPLATAHQFSYQADNVSGTGLVFDNGHRRGTLGLGNWGYEGCGQQGGCTNLRIRFAVHTLPDSLQAVSCPLRALQLHFDGELGTWHTVPSCDNAPMYFEGSALGSPILAGQVVGTGTPYSNATDFTIYPNPVAEKLYVQAAEPGYRQCRILNALGELVYEGPLLDGGISTVGWPKGLYILQLHQDAQQVVATFVKH